MRASRRQPRRPTTCKPRLCAPSPATRRGAPSSSRRRPCPAQRTQQQRIDGRLVPQLHRAIQQQAAQQQRVGARLAAQRARQRPHPLLLQLDAPVLAGRGTGGAVEGRGSEGRQLADVGDEWQSCGHAACKLPTEQQAGSPAARQGGAAPCRGHRWRSGWPAAAWWGPPPPPRAAACAPHTRRRRRSRRRRHSRRRGRPRCSGGRPCGLLCCCLCLPAGGVRARAGRAHCSSARQQGAPRQAAGGRRRQRRRRAVVRSAAAGGVCSSAWPSGMGQVCPARLAGAQSAAMVRT